MLRIFWMILWVSGLSSFATASEGAKVAFVIGNGSYAHAPNLSNPANDARLMANTLTDIGFDVVQVLDGKHADLLEALVQFGRKAARADVALVFYAGHGVQVNGRNWLLPVDVNVETSTDLQGQAIRADDLLELMEFSGARLKLVFFDACRNNPFSRSLSRSVSRGLARLDANTAGTLIAFATAPGDVASDGGRANSPFTTALARYIREPGLEVRQMLGKVREEVYLTTNEQQLPWVNEALIGEFYFAGRTEEMTTPGVASAESINTAFQIAAEINTAVAYDAFLRQFPSGSYADLARAAVDNLEKKASKVGSSGLSGLPQSGGSPEIVVASVPKDHLTAPDYADGACSQSRSGGHEVDYCVSSILDPQHGNRYGPVNLIDGDRSTAWVEGADGEGLGAKILLDFGEKRSLAGLRIINGYTKNKRLFARNGRVRRLAATLSTGDIRTFEISDTMAGRSYLFPMPLNIKWIELEISSTYRGSKYSDTAISELAPVFAD